MTIAGNDGVSISLGGCLENAVIGRVSDDISHRVLRLDDLGQSDELGHRGLR
jgi:hypothetical protein